MLIRPKYVRLCRTVTYISHRLTEAHVSSARPLYHVKQLMNTHRYVRCSRIFSPIQISTIHLLERFRQTVFVLTGGRDGELSDLEILMRGESHYHEPHDNELLVSGQQAEYTAVVARIKELPSDNDFDVN